MVTYTDAQMVDDLAQQLFESLVADAPTPPTIDFSDPKYDFSPDLTSDLYTDTDAVQLEDLTEVDLAGAGVFDKLMASVDLHIQREFKGNRITGDQYAKVYTEVMSGVLGSSVQFLLAKDQAHWAAITAQMQARIAEIQATKALIELEETKFNTQKALFEMQNSGAQYALTKMQLAGENQKHFLMQAQTDGEVYRVRNLLPAELAIQQYQRMQVLPSTVAINQVQSSRVLPAEAAIKEFINRELQPIEKLTAAYNVEVSLPIKTDIDEFQRDSLLPVQLAQEQHKLNQQLPAQTGFIKEQWETQRAQTLNTRTDGLTTVVGMVGKQKDSITADIETKQFNIDFVLPVQLDLVKEQHESERSKTKDVRSDGTVVVGSVGKQKDLYTQQIDSFIKDAQYKTAKMYLDGWITQKTLNEDLVAPTELTNTEINEVLVSNRANNDL
jgi:hypothetical protein